MPPSAPREVSVKPVPLDPEQRRWYEAACARLDAERLTKLLVELTSVHSPTGAERPASEFMVETFRSAGLEAEYQPMGPERGNAIGRRRGSGEGPTLLLYEPIDTHMETAEADELPWAGSAFRADMKPEGFLRDGLVIGLGASNPKAMVSTIYNRLIKNFVEHSSSCLIL